MKQPILEMSLEVGVSTAEVSENEWRNNAEMDPLIPIPEVSGIDVDVLLLEQRFKEDFITFCNAFVVEALKMHWNQPKKLYMVQINACVENWIQI